jgi:hydroxyacylglutathione hydrolase
LIKIKTFVFNPFSENTYLVWDEKSGQGVIIDPGCSNSSEENILKTFLEENNITLKYLFNTHAHIDHVLGNAFIKENYDLEFWGGEKDNFILEMLEEIGNNYGIHVNKSPLPDKYFDEANELFLGHHKISFIFTPGHSPGEFSIYFPGSKICFTGDVLFEEGIGRTDLWGGDFDVLEHSILEKLYILPIDTKIYPGHGSASSIDHERNYNPFIIAAD